MDKLPDSINKRLEFVYERNGNIDENQFGESEILEFFLLTGWLPFDYKPETTN